MPDQPGDLGALGDPGAEESLPRPWGRRRLAVTALKAVLAVLALWWFARVVRRVDWPAVWDAVAQLGGLEVAALLAVVAVRQSLNAGPARGVRPVPGPASRRLERPVRQPRRHRCAASG